MYIRNCSAMHICRSIELIYHTSRYCPNLQYFLERVVKGVLLFPQLLLTILHGSWDPIETVFLLPNFLSISPPVLFSLFGDPIYRAQDVLVVNFTEYNICPFPCIWTVYSVYVSSTIQSVTSVMFTSTTWLVYRVFRPRRGNTWPHVARRDQCGDINKSAPPWLGC